MQHIFSKDFFRKLILIIKKATRKPLRKELKLLDVYAVATGATLSAGFFLLPGLAAAQSGSAIVVAYVLAVIPLVPAMFSIIELGTAMPRAGGVYFFLDRTLGPSIGTIAGVGTWLALILKVAFALFGMGAYIALFFPSLPIVPIGVAIAVVIGILNLLSVKGSGSLQIFLVTILLFILLIFLGGGLPQINFENFRNVFDTGWASIFSTTGLVYISYVGITKAASLSEEIKDPERNLPRGIFLALGTTLLINALGTFVMVGVIPIDELAGDLTPVATAAGKYFGEIGTIVVSIAAIFAFISVSNGGTLSASRYPFAMSRDHILPSFFYKMSTKGIPVVSVIATIAIVILILVSLNPTGIAKLASAFQLLIFAFACFAVIVMRESRIESYDPGYKSPLYPWMQIFGIIAPLFLIVQMGILSILFSSGLIVIGIAWYMYYVRNKTIRTGAIYHIFARLGRNRNITLDTELRGILKEKGLRESDPFEEILMRAHVIDLETKAEFEDVAERAAWWMSQLVDDTKEEIKKMFMDGTRMGATPVTHNIALPHLRLKGLLQAEMVLVRSIKGIHIKFNDPLTDSPEEEEAIVNAVFFLISPISNPTQHLRILAQIAGRVEEESFSDEWSSAKNDQELKETLLHEDRCLSIIVSKDLPTEKMIDKKLSEINIPKGCLVALLRREGITLVPNGSTVFSDDDRLTVIGDPKGLETLKKEYSIH